jgi:uncharacterized protein GlcG (DUF336 family)
MAEQTQKEPNIFQKIASGLAWFGKEIGKGIAFVPKLIVLADDVKDAAQEALPLAIAVITDAGNLIAATAKDGGKFLVALSSLAAALTVAVANKALNVSADTAVVAAFENFCADFNTANVQDILTAWHQLATDVAKLDSTVLGVLDKLKADA